MNEQLEQQKKQTQNSLNEIDVEWKEKCDDQLEYIRLLREQLYGKPEQAEEVKEPEPQVIIDFGSKMTPEIITTMLQYVGFE